MKRLILVAVLLLSATSVFATLTLPSNVTAEATSPSGAAVSYASSTTGIGDDENGRPLGSVTCSPASGSTFALGTTTVSCHDTAGATGSFTVTVSDTKGPELHIPRSFSLQATSSNTAVATWTASATDLVDGGVAISCSPASGSTFALGTTSVGCTATDSRNNVSTDYFSVNVYAPAPPPTPTLPNDITREATGPSGAVVTYTATGGTGDDENGRPTSNANCSPASGSTFALGTTTVQCTGGSFHITIVDTTAPSLHVPADITKQATSASGASVSFTATASDLVDGSVAVACTPPSGSTFAVGTTVVACSATDAHGNGANDSFSVTVTEQPVDDEAPVITSISASPNELFGPNNKFVTVTVTVSAFDNEDHSPLIRIYDVTSDEEITSSDWEITSNLKVDLRADRDPQGDGRTYTIHVEAIDDAGNRSVSSVDVFVPHDQGQNSTAAPPPAKRRSVGRG